MRIELIESGRGTAFDRSIRHEALVAAEAAGVDLIVRAPVTASVLAQQELLAAARPDEVAAVVLVPIDYVRIAPGVRAAHDRQLPAIVVGPTRPMFDPVAWSFVTSDTAAAGAAAASVLRQRAPAVDHIVVMRSRGDSAQYEMGVRRAAGRLPVEAATIDAARTTRRVSAVARARGGGMSVVGIVAIGPAATAAARRVEGGSVVVAIGATRAQVRYLQHGDVEALVSQQPTAIGSAAVAAAIDAGFGRNPASDQQVPYVVIYRTSLPNAATSRALYRS